MYITALNYAAIACGRFVLFCDNAQHFVVVVARGSSTRECHDLLRTRERAVTPIYIIYIYIYIYRERERESVEMARRSLISLCNTCWIYLY